MICSNIGVHVDQSKDIPQTLPQAGDGLSLVLIRFLVLMHEYGSARLGIRKARQVVVPRSRGRRVPSPLFASHVLDGADERGKGAAKAGGKSARLAPTATPGNETRTYNHHKHNAGTGQTVGWSLTRLGSCGGVGAGRW